MLLTGRQLSAPPTPASRLFSPNAQLQISIEPRPGDGSDDEQNTAQTIRHMAEYARQDSASPIIRRAAHAATATARDARSQAAAIHQWIRAHVKFTEDAELAAGLSGAPEDAEVLIRPVDLLTMSQPQGDCDDFSMLCAAMLRALGIAAHFKTVAAAADSPDYSHVYVVAQLPAGELLALDCSHGPYPGWEVEPQGKTRLWPVEDTHMMRALGRLGDDDSGTNYWDVIQTGLEQAGGILGTRYAVPQTSPGQTIRLPNGTVATQLPYGVTAAASSMSSTFIVVAVIGLVAVLVLSRK